MTVYVNEKKTILHDTPNTVHTVASLIKEMNVPDKGTAVALNNRMVRRDNWAKQELAENDKILLIRAAYGG